MTLAHNLLGGGGGPTEVEKSFATSAASNSTTVTMPTIQAGDLAICFNGARNGGGEPTTVTPAGFIEIVTETNGSGERKLRVSYKILDGTESGASLSGMNGSIDEHLTVVIVRASAPINGVNIVDVDADITNGNPGSQTCTASGGQVPLVGIGIAYYNQGTGAFTVEPTWDDEVANRARVGMIAYDLGDTPANFTIDKGDQGNTNGLVSFYVELT